VALALALCSGCSKDLSLPDPSERPRIVDFKPHYAYAGDRLTVWSRNVDEVGNTLLFPDGARVQAQLDEEGLRDLVVTEEAPDGTPSTALTFVVPEGQSLKGRLVLVNTLGQSEPSGPDFGPLGNGYPNKGTPVASLRFRHDPVGLVDTYDNVLMASSLFDLLVTDGKAKYVAPGKPIALRASPNSPDPGRSLLSVETPTGGLLLEVQTIDGKETLRSDETEVRERFILPPADSASVARTLGDDAQGRTFFTIWSITGGRLVPTRRLLTFAEILGASANGPLTVLVARETRLSTPTVHSLSLGGAVRMEWNPRLPSTPVDCAQDGPLCELPDGPIALVPMPEPVLMDGGLGPAPEARVVVSVESGDLVMLQDLKLQTGGNTPAVAESLTLISYAPVEALAAGTVPGKVVFTKSLDGALFQYDLETGEADWAVQIRGEPSLIDVEPAIDEIAVGNRIDNAVDIVRASTGTWIGRVAFSLGVGSADRGPGGIVAPYTYATNDLGLERMDLLMRNVGLVVSINASSLEIIDSTRVNDDVEFGAPLRLAVTHDFRTLVFHEGAIGVLVDGADGTRSERRVASFEPGFEPRDVVVMASGDVLVSSVSDTPELNVVRTFRWQGPALVRVGDLRMPDQSKLLALAPAGSEVLVFWQTQAGGFGGGFYAPRDFAQSSPKPVKALSFDPTLRDYLGVAVLEDGPSLFFGRLGTSGPRALRAEDLRGDQNGVPSVVTGLSIAGATPGGDMAVWLDEDSSEPMARLVFRDVDGFTGYATYRLAGPSAGPAFDPSGEWLYLPVPLLDQLDVVQ
jgi:hypothetical protein